MYSFYRASSFQFLDISSVLPYIGIDAVQVTFNLENGSMVPSEERFAFEPCAGDYLDGFIGEYVTPDYYGSIENCFCLPRNISFEISEFKQVYFSIYDKI